MLPPWAFDALGRGPASGSEPLTTVIHDLLLLIYFAIPSTILR